MYLDRKGSHKHVTGEKALLMARVYNFKNNTKPQKIRRKKFSFSVLFPRAHQTARKGKQKNT